MTLPGPEIAVVVPTYRRPSLLPRVVAALEKQTLAPERFEVLIVDNGSGDETSEVLASLSKTTALRLRPLAVKVNRGPAVARNLGWRSSTAPFVAFTDDDCAPDPRWLESGLTQLRFCERVGVVQGRTLRPDDRDYPYTDWTTFREVLSPSPWFEGCNLFFRRKALEETGGFDETIPFSGEDTVSGWSVIAAGWERVYDQDAVVRHDLAERGVWWHAQMGWREGNLLAVSRRYPGLRTEGFWKPWALRPRNVAFAAGVVGTAVGAGIRKPGVAAAAWVPWTWMRRPPPRHHRAARLLAERWFVDAATFAGMKVAAVRWRQLVL